MFAKVFEQIFDSSIAENYQVRHMFMDLLVMANSDGVVDKTPEAIARIANVPIDIVQSALCVLASPDNRSRTPDYDGRRIELVDSHRDWGWRIINYEKYRKIRDEESRRIANKIYQQNSRARKKIRNVSSASALAADSQQCQPMQREKQINLNTHKGGENTYSSEKISPPPQKFTQQDFDERDIRKLGEAQTELLKKLGAQVGYVDQMTEDEFFAASCEIAGITVQRGLKLREIQKVWPK